MEQLERYRHCVGESALHLQFTPKYRREVFEDNIIQERCRAILQDIAKRLGIELSALEFGPDHAHAFVTRWRKYSPSQLAQYLKGASSRELRLTLWERVKRYEWGKAFWSSGYYFGTVGRVTSETVKYYIERQQGKHWEHCDFDAEHSMETKCQILRSTRQTKLDIFAADTA